MVLAKARRFAALRIGEAAADERAPSIGRLDLDRAGRAAVLVQATMQRHDDGLGVEVRL